VTSDRVEVWIAGVARPDAAGWGYAIEKDGVIDARGGPGAPGDSAPKMTVHALREALGALGADRRVITVHTTDPNTAETGASRLAQWRADGWRKKGGAIANLELWQVVARRLDGHDATWERIEGAAPLHAQARELATAAAQSAPPPAAAPTAAIPVAASSSRLVAYADGGCRGNPGGIGGWGMVLIDTKTGSALEKRGGDPSTTNNRMEMTAAIQALECLKAPGQSIEIRSDSRYLVDMASKWIPGWKRAGWTRKGDEPIKNLDLVKRLDALQSAHTVRWTWVKGHSGDPGNDRVDALANAAMDSIKAGKPADWELRHEKSPLLPR
jgi:ribonuclease HI